MYEHNALGYWWGLTLCLTKVRSSRARCPVTALINLIMKVLCSFYHDYISVMVTNYCESGSIDQQY